ncbi:MAG: M20/M25/M40 family metallo-hydrolase [Candidatus Cloacimonas sp.]
MQKDVVKYFLELINIDSESKNERAMMDKLKMDLEELGATVEEDDCYTKTNGNAGNLLARFEGTINKKPILFCAHSDTVTPGNSIKPKIANNIIRSDETTVLGADDKSGIAEIIVALKHIKDKGIEHTPIEVLITVSEEIGLLGAKHFDKSKLKADIGYAFDSNQVGELVIGAPYQNTFVINFYGKEAHAGVEPEKGLNAIRLASDSIVAMPNGRIDFETTCNLGSIYSGSPTNIVPKEVVVKGEARSHNKAKLNKVCNEIEQAVISTVERYNEQNGNASYKFEMEEEYEGFLIPRNALVVTLAENALRALDVPSNIKILGGGSDANIFNAQKIPTLIVGTGMNNIHTVKESIDIDQLYKGAAFVEQLIIQYSEK